MLRFTEIFPTANKIPQTNLFVGIILLNMVFRHAEPFLKSIFVVKLKASVLNNKHLAEDESADKGMGDGC